MISSQQRLHFERIERDDFPDNEEKILPLYHVVCMMWAHSAYYGVNSRMIILFKMISNLMIENCSKYLDPGSLFQGEPDESLANLNRVIKILETYRNCFKEFRDRLPEFKERFCPDKNRIFWTFKPTECFGRFDCYMERLNAVRDIFDTANEFFKLEKLELGGIKGRTHSRNVSEVLNDFKSLYMKWAQIQFDPLDPSPAMKDFDNEKKKFRRHTEVLERRLGSVLMQAFDECHTIESIIKLIEICGASLLQRPIIFSEIRQKLDLMVAIYDDDLDKVKTIYDGRFKIFEKSGIENLDIDKSFPPVAGVITWIKQMKSRITKPADELKNIKEFHYVFETEEGVETKEKLDEMSLALNEFDKKVFTQWVGKIPEVIKQNMRKFLIKRLDDGHLELNFDLQLVEALKEVKLLQSMKRDGIPDIALELFEFSDELWVS